MIPSSSLSLDLAAQPEHLPMAKTGVLAGSLLAGMLGVCVVVVVGAQKLAAFGQSSHLRAMYTDVRYVSGSGLISRSHWLELLA